MFSLLPVEMFQVHHSARFLLDPSTPSSSKEGAGSDLETTTCPSLARSRSVRLARRLCIQLICSLQMGVEYHKSCFRCSHCKSTLKLSNYSSMEGFLYCRPHFEQLYKESGNFSKNFQSSAKSADKLTPELTRSPSKAAGMFSGTQDKCALCGKTAYPLEKVTVENQAYEPIIKSVSSVHTEAVPYHLQIMQH